MTSSAPSERTSSTFFVLQTAVTCAPKCFASCTAAVPQRARRAVDDEPRPLADVRRLEARERPGSAPSQTAAASSNVMPAGMCASGPLSRTQTYSACAPLQRHAEHAVADRELRDRRAHRLDLAGELDAEDPLLAAGGSPRMKRQKNGLRPARCGSPSG